MFSLKVDRVLKLLITLGAVQMAGIVGSFFTASKIPTWYAELAKPELAPPNWVFAPVWISLFVFIGISAFLVWDRGLKRRDVRIALGVFIFQLVLNTFWSIIFFGLQSPGWAFIWIALLWSAIIVNILFFLRISKVAGLLLVPYFLWVSFAAYLNYAIWTLN